LETEYRARQSNVIWPYSLRGQRALFAFLWRGEENPTKLQRIGLWMQGALCLWSGILMLGLARQDRLPPLAMLAFGAMGFGARAIWNGCRRQAISSRRPPTS